MSNSISPNMMFQCNFKIFTILLLFLCGFLFAPSHGSDLDAGRENSYSKRVIVDKIKSLLKEGKHSKLEILSFLTSKHPSFFDKSLSYDVEEKRLMRKKRSFETRDVSYDRNTEGRHYVDSIFWRYGDEPALSLEHLDVLLARIGLKKMTRYANETHDHEANMHEGHDHEGHDHGGHDREGHDHGGHDHGGHDHQGHNHGGHDHEGPHGGHDHEGHVHRRDTTDLHADHHHGNDTEEEEEPEKCLSSTELLYDFGMDGKTELDETDFLFLCPALIYQLDTGACHMEEDDHHHGDDDDDGKDIGALVWVYSMVSVLIISLCALFGILCIPRRGGHENKVMQFLIALAMGSMSGDGMLHLIPHSMAPHKHSSDDHHEHHGEEEKEEVGHDLDGLYKGLVALMGIYVFFFLERGFAVMRTRRDAKKMRSSGVATPMMGMNGANDANDYGHDHGHSHEGLFSCTSLAMMIIVGDMFHNFCDGLAIGAAFAGSLSVGISTSIAVFCHELPHEIGDFAVLITSGMSAKRAIAFNMLSTVPCFLGAAIGLELGSLGDLSLWIFAFVGGLFLYISLVDLVPEMTKAYTRVDGPWLWYIVLHLSGMMLGVIIMLILGIYENDLQKILT